MEKKMIDEIREYVAMPGKLPALIELFNTKTLALLEKHGMKVIQIGMTSIGDHSFGEVVYTLRFKDLAEMECKWAAFLADKDFVSALAKSTADGPLLQSMKRRVVTFAPFGEER
jgi:hypothetical protein